MTGTAEMTQEGRLAHLRRTIRWAEEKTEFYRAAFARAGISQASVTSFADMAQLPLLACAENEGADAPFFMLTLPFSSLLRVSVLWDKERSWTHCYTQGDIARQVQTTAEMLAGCGVHRASVVLLVGDFGDSRTLDLQYGLEAIGAAVLPCTGIIGAQTVALAERVMPDTIIAWERDLPDLCAHAEIRTHHLITLGSRLRPGAFARETAESLGTRHTHLFTRAEMGAWIGCSCTGTEGIHLEERLFFAEVIDAEDKSSREDGASGELVLSTIAAEAMPVLRYRTGLRARFVRGRCACGDERLRIMEE